MIGASTVLRIALVLVAAGGLMALVQFLWPHPVSEEAAPTVVAAEEPARSPVPEPAPTAPPPVVRQAETSIAPPAPAAAIPATPTPATPTPAAPTPAAPVADPPAPAATSPEPDEMPIRPAQPSSPRALALVDLNTGSLSDLNHLRGAGSIGRAIIQKRPYASVDQLLSKRVLSRATYERVKDQVTVQ